MLANIFACVCVVFTTLLANRLFIAEKFLYVIQLVDVPYTSYSSEQKSSCFVYGLLCFAFKHLSENVNKMLTKCWETLAGVLKCWGKYLSITLISKEKIKL